MVRPVEHRHVVKKMDVEHHPYLKVGVELGGVGGGIHRHVQRTTFSLSLQSNARNR